MSVYDEINDLIGAPYRLGEGGGEGMDCWGLVRHVMALRGTPLPSYPRPQAESGIARKVLQSFSAFRDRVEQVEHPQEWDMVTVHRGRVACHIGIMVAGRVLHTDAGRTKAVLEDPTLFRVEYGPDLRWWRWLG